MLWFGFLFIQHYKYYFKSSIIIGKEFVLGLFDNIFAKSSSEQDLVNSLVEIAAFGAGDEGAQEKSNMDSVLARTESQMPSQASSMLLYWLGIAWRNYTARYIRGDERKLYLEKATEYFRKALVKAKEEWPLRQPLENRHIGGYLDQITIAGDLGLMLVNDAPIRNLEEAEKVLQFVSENTKEYEPCLCSLAELYYKQGNYEKAAEVALDAYERAQNSAEWKDGVPPAPLNIAGMAYRALGRAAKKSGNTDDAEKWFGAIIKLGVASDNDKKIYEKLKVTKGG